MQRTTIILSVIAVILGAGCAALGYLWYTQNEEYKEYRADAERTEASLSAELTSTALALDDANTQITRLSGTLDETSDELREEKDRNDEFKDQINKIAGTVGDLDKLSKTDKELLQKYSKVYFLNEHYVPESLREIDDEWKYSEDRQHQLHSKVIPFFENMLEDAKDDGINLWVVSAYRSFEYQSQLKGAYTVTYGSGANTFSADQGFSEHQLGTTVDFTTNGLGGGLQGFGNTPAYEWLTKNAHKYGFVLSYPEDNSHYIFEPWHWRFVGTELADDMHDDGTHFYDEPQREIDQYLLHIFD
ncbi:MAG: M15 family metallopeptidase [Candidatus Paceibacterota bacterium]